MKFVGYTFCYRPSAPNLIEIRTVVLNTQHMEVFKCVLEWEDNIKIDLSEINFEAMRVDVTGFGLFTLAATNSQI